MGTGEAVVELMLLWSARKGSGTERRRLTSDEAPGQASTYSEYHLP